MPSESWRRDNYLVSTDPALLQVEAINAALGSDMVWWTGKLPQAALREALHGSLCFGLYELPPEWESNGVASSSASNGIKLSSEQFSVSLRQIGLVRVVTDNVTFAYLTDVYVLHAHQGTGLGRWLLEILNGKLQSWPHLRRIMLLTSDKMELFHKHLGVKDYAEVSGMNGVSVAMVEGPGAHH